MDYYELTPFIKERAKEALHRFLRSDALPSVNNPILLLNYLHQHSIIPQPIYEFIPQKTNGGDHFIVTCNIGGGTTVGQGISKKSAKTAAAEQQLNLLLEDDISMDTDFSYNSMPHSSYVDTSSKNTRIPQDEKFYIDDLSNIYSFDSIECTQLDPQGPSCEVADEILNNSEICETIATMPYFDPFASIQISRLNRIPPSESITRSKVTNEKQQMRNNTIPNSNDATIIDDDVQMLEIRTSNTEEKNTTIAKNASNTKLENVPVNYVSYSTFVYPASDYFDPFVQFKPTSTISQRQQLPIDADNVSSSCDEVTNTDQMKDFPREDDEKLEKMKSPFAILKEKSFKMFKLIPRCQIEESKSGFTCTMVLSSYTCVSEGSSKKLAKMNAATAMLKEIEKSES